MAQTWENAVDREAAWFMAEPPLTYPTAPRLLKDKTTTPTTGFFDAVQAYRPNLLPAKGKHLWIYRDYRQPQPERVYEHGGGYIWLHRLVAHIWWNFSAQNRGNENMERELERAIAAVLARIRGPFGVKTHAGATNGAEGFNDVANVNDEPDVEFVDDPRVAIEVGGSCEVLISYSANDHFYG